MGVYIKLRKSIPGSNKVLVVGLPGMGRVGYITANFIVDKLGGTLVGEVYSTHFPSQLDVNEDGMGSLITGRIYDIGNALVFTADVQPQSHEGQNFLSKKVLQYLSKKGISFVVSAAAYVVPSVTEIRRVYVSGTNGEAIERFTSIGAQRLRGGMISGMNGAIIGWSKYFGIPGAVLLGETWAPLVEIDESDFRAAKYVLDILAKFLGVEIDTRELDAFATHVEQRVAAALAKVTAQREELRRPRSGDREVM